MIEHHLVRATVTPEIVRLIGEAEHIPEKEALKHFYQSITAANYADEETGLYGQSALFLFSMYQAEKQHVPLPVA